MPTNIDEFLKAQDRDSIFYLVTEVDGQPAMARVTPWSPTLGPLMAISLAVPRSSIAAIEPQQITTEVGGLLHRVVAVHFISDDAGSLLESAFRQLAASYARGISAARKAAPPAVLAASPLDTGPSIRRDWCGWHWPTWPVPGDQL